VERCPLRECLSKALQKAFRRRIIRQKSDEGGASMSALSRRHFLSLTGSAAASAIGGSAFAAMKPNDKFDLVIKGGEVLDPSQSLRAKRDVGIRWGVVESLDESIPAERALKTIDASG
jgi:dihydroorotase